MKTWFEPRDIKLLLWEKLNTSREFAVEMAMLAGLPAGVMQSFCAELLVTSTRPFCKRDIFFFCTIDGNECAALLEFCFGEPVESRSCSRSKLLLLERKRPERFKKGVCVLLASEEVLASDPEAKRYPEQIKFSDLFRLLERMTPERSGFYREVFDNLVPHSCYVSGGTMILE